MEQGPYKAVGEALEVIPRTLAQNCGANIIRTLTKLRAKHSDPSGGTFGIDGNSGKQTRLPPAPTVPHIQIKSFMHSSKATSICLSWSKSIH